MLTAAETANSLKTPCNVVVSLLLPGVSSFVSVHFTGCLVFHSYRNLILFSLHARAS